MADLYMERVTSYVAWPVARLRQDVPGGPFQGVPFNLGLAVEDQSLPLWDANGIDGRLGANAQIHLAPNWWVGLIV